jgi:hypothetical protein
MKPPDILQRFLDKKIAGPHSRSLLTREWRSYWKQHSLVKAVGTKMNIKVITGFQGLRLVADDPANPNTKDFGVTGELWVTKEGWYTTEHMFFYLDLESNTIWNEFGQEIVAENKDRMINEIKERIKKETSR